MFVTLYVRHKGVPKMVGKIFPVGGAPIMYHANRGGVPQAHIKYDSPGGVDAIVLDYLDRLGAFEVHHEQVDGRLFVATVADIRTFGVRDRAGGRDRFYLPWAWWERRDRNYDVPWVQATLTLGAALPEPHQQPRLPL